MPTLYIVFLSLAVSQLLVLGIYIFLYHRRSASGPFVWRSSTHIDVRSAWGRAELYSQSPKPYGLDLLYYGAQSHRQRLDVFNLALVAETI